MIIFVPADWPRHAAGKRNNAAPGEINRGKAELDKVNRVFGHGKSTGRIYQTNAMAAAAPTLLILAAGMGSRYGGLKQIDPVGPSGESIIDYSIYDAIRAGYKQVVFIIRKSIEKDMREVFDGKLEGRIETDYVYQELDMVPEGFTWPEERKKPWGTAHAVWIARDTVSGPFVVINADDYYGPDAYEKTAGYLSGEGDRYTGRYCMVGYRIRHTLSDYGSVSRGLCHADGQNNLRAVEEITEIERHNGNISYRDPDGIRVSLSGDELVSMNIWGFTPSLFGAIEQEFRSFLRKNARDIKAELYLPAIISRLVKSGQARVKILPAVDQWFGITYREDKPLAINRISQLIREGLYPEKLWS